MFVEVYSSKSFNSTYLTEPAHNRIVLALHNLEGSKTSRREMLALVPIPLGLHLTGALGVMLLARGAVANS